jgi:MFS family permease
MWSFVVSLPAVESEFGIARGAASLPYTLTMLGFAAGGVVMGRLADRAGVFLPLQLGALSLGAGYIGASAAPGFTLYALAHLLVGFGSSASFVPLMSDLSHWFARRRALAVTIASSGNYVAGVLWPPLIAHVIAADGWRIATLGTGIACLLTLPPLAMAVRARAPRESGAQGATPPRFGTIDLPAGALMTLLVVAGVACCVAMSMPQVHIVAYCADLGYGPAHGAEMLSAMLAFGIVSRIGAGLIADRIGGLATLLIAATLQGIALFLYLFFDSLASLYAISALFGLFQGGLVPMYAVIVREYFPPERSGGTLGIIIMATLGGMAFGGWIAGWIFDRTGSYQMAFVNGLAWNLLNVAIVTLLMTRRRFAPAVAA